MALSAAHALAQVCLGVDIGRRVLEGHVDILVQLAAGGSGEAKANVGCLLHCCGGVRLDRCQLSRCRPIPSLTRTSLKTTIGSRSFQRDSSSRVR